MPGQSYFTTGIAVRCEVKNKLFINYQHLKAQKHFVSIDLPYSGFTVSSVQLTHIKVYESRYLAHLATSGSKLETTN